MRRLAASFALIAAAGVSACGSPIEVYTGCTPANGFTPICGPHNPEDLVAVPSGEWILFGEFRGLSGPGVGAGAIGAVHVVNRTIMRLYPSPAAGRPDGAGAGSPPGDPTCPGPPDPNRFSLHGLSLAAFAGEPLRLLAVNHGGREAIEIFGVRADASPPQLTWQGCVPLPDGLEGNDVAALPGGGLLVTAYSSNHAWTAVAVLLRLTNGAVHEWLPGAGWREVPGTRAALPNGILVSADGATLYVAASRGDEVFRVQRQGDPARTSVPVAAPDNLTWTADGDILAASLRTPLMSVMRTCRDLATGACGGTSAVVRVRPQPLAATDLLVHTGAPLGAFTAAIAVGNELFVGTAFGDRLAVTSLPTGDADGARRARPGRVP